MNAGDKRKSIDGVNDTHMQIGTSWHRSLNLFRSQEHLLSSLEVGDELVLKLTKFCETDRDAEHGRVYVVVYTKKGQPIAYFDGNEMRALRECMSMAINDDKDVRMTAVVEGFTTNLDLQINYLYPLFTPGKFKWDIIFGGIFQKYGMESLCKFVKQESTLSNKGHNFGMDDIIRLDTTAFGLGVDVADTNVNMFDHPIPVEIDVLHDNLPVDLDVVHESIVYNPGFWYS